MPRPNSKPHVKAVALEQWQSDAMKDDMRAEGYRSVQDWLEDAVLAKLAPRNSQARALLKIKQEERKLRQEARR